MRFDLLTPHQFTNFSEYVDTLYISTFTPAPLDVSAPLAASRLIVEEISQRVMDRFAGRALHSPLGAVPLYAGVSEPWAETLQQLYPHVFRYGFVLSDRWLTEKQIQLVTANTQWVVMDWWQWLRARIPKTRQADAWLFLCHATHSYQAAPERAEAGFDESIAKEMEEEGNRLMEHIASWVSQTMMNTWYQNSSL